MTRLPSSIRAVLVALALSAATGCQYEAASRACYDIVDEIAARGTVCGYYPTEEVGREDLLAQLAADGLSCDTSPTGIRDAEELYEVCLPELSAFDCAALGAGSVPAACEDQIVYRGR